MNIKTFLLHAKQNDIIHSLNQLHDKIDILFVQPASARIAHYASD